MNSLMLGPLVGGLSSTQAFLWGRAGGPGTLHAWVGALPDLSDARLAATSLPLTSQTGFAGVAPLTGLSPNTRYSYALTLDPAHPDPQQGPYPAFTTFPPDGEPISFAFAFGSCFRPANENGGQIFRALEARRQADQLRFILMIGDQIYADAYDKNGIGKIACNLEEYRAVYAYTWSRPAFRDLLPNLPVFMTLDDHEVDDDWAWTDPQRQGAYLPIWDRVIRRFQGRPLPERRLPPQRVRDALQAYWEHQGMHAPPHQRSLQLDGQGQYALSPGDPGSLAYTFTFGAAAFFVLDTRTMRTKGSRGRTMLGEGQWQALERWLLAVKDRYPVKFLVSSGSVLLNLWIDLARDRWSGFPGERTRLLRFIADHGIEGVHLLTGDLHSSHAVRAELAGPDGRTFPLWEYCSTPFEQEPNRWTSRFYSPLHSDFIRSQERFFNLAHLNFGVVRVDMVTGGKARVRFEVYGKDGELLGAVAY
jgi:phosphodiesterase/alkaline phosphatase D-like protein